MKLTKPTKKDVQIQLRLLERRDLPKIVHWLMGTDYVKNYITDYPVSSERDLKNQLLKEIAVNKFIFASTQVLVAEGGENILVGMVILKNIDWRSRHLDLQVYLPEEFRKTNLAFLTANAAYAYVFKQLNMHKVYTYLLGQDKEKIKVHQAAGHEPEAVLYDYVYDGKTYQDLHIYALYKADIVKEKA